jgi:protein-S-isoprenylcysteine O-methyltransferase Ste14
LGTQPKPTPDSPGVIARPPLIAVAILLAGVVSHLLRPVPIGPRMPLRLTGAALALAGVCIALAARAMMVRAGTNMSPTLPATTIVTGGPYRLTRNPMYLALCLLNLGVGLLLCDLVPAALTAVLAAVLNFGVVAREERYLERKFGAEYSAYKRRVRRWL